MQKKKTDDELVQLQNAFVVPPLAGSVATRTSASGVLDADKNLVEQSISWSDSSHQVNTTPEIPEGTHIEELKGRYIFGGIFYGHFGHFIAESMSRLWALDSVDEHIDGMIFTPKFANFPDSAVKTRTPLAEHLGLRVPIVLAHDVLRVEELYVPQQGIGMYDLAEGTPAFRKFINNYAGVNIPAKGSERLYISRSKLPPDRGSILGEERLEEYLAEEGYEIFHPQKFSAEDQIARYKAAKYIIGVDCSPFHMLAYVGNSEQVAGVITRRSMPIANYLVKQLIALKDMKAIEINCLVNDWVMGARPSRNSRGEADFVKMREELISAGLIEGKSEWTNPTIDERAQEIERLGQEHKNKFVPFKKDVV